MLTDLFLCKDLEQDVHKKRWGRNIEKEKFERESGRAMIKY